MRLRSVEVDPFVGLGGIEDGSSRGHVPETHSRALDVALVPGVLALEGEAVEHAHGLLLHKGAALDDQE